jgi:hypothetical protein
MTLSRRRVRSPLDAAALQGRLRRSGPRRAHQAAGGATGGG